ncbi:hypothetical protein I5K46_24580 [Pseudomonas aeruginosa]|uniref:hypothetical protein n=1 Tax=Pseudomonas aeruginosa TaxID=287 RepID=UPI000452B551|nr:hypothetical protein [Pseudomonas aeruginosa]EZO29197.1 hypothetical protein AJ61_04971 [Pseudomonas aeruginosa 3574]MBH9242769.1 hypothetical protein [Pseudomonas aeruginosa]NYU33204.1 lactate permease [Pseudomonas aeruginosa]HBO5114249.1 hypothetical protein [Pseudomonas aeruginosa]HCD6290685.1 hypothetical protein [Pseudomonas aeruginosa]
MTDRIERFKARRQLQTQLREQPALVALPSTAETAVLLQQPVNQSRIDEAFGGLSLDLDVEVCEADIDAALHAFSESFGRERFGQLLNDSRREVLQAVAVPFGLGRVLAVYDKVGGNVDTIHNAREGVYATDEARQQYDERSEYDSDKYHGDKRYKDKNAKDTIAQEEGRLRDAYTGETMGRKQTDPRNLDHTIAAKEIHEDAGRILAGVDGVKLANDSSNLNPTKERFNKYKGQRRAEDVVAQLQQESPERRKRITELESKTELTVKERNELELHKQKQTIADNPEQLLAKDKVAREKYEGKLRDEYYRSKKFRDDLLGTSVKEGGKMAFQQAFGLMLVEFFAATFDEIQDCYRKGPVHDSWWPELRERMQRVAARVAKQWKVALAAAGAGFVSGFLSNMVTVLLNTLKTTGKRAIRMFREGFMSLLRALRVLASPPKGMSPREGAHEALKVICAGAVVIGGVALEEYIEKQILAVPGLGAMGTIVSVVVVGALTGLASTFIVYLLDRLDPLGVNRNRELAALQQYLDGELEEVRGSNDQLLLTLEAALDC